MYQINPRRLLSSVTAAAVVALAAIAPSSVTGAPVRLNRRPGDVCVFVDEGYMGGFSNSLAFFNEAMTWTTSIEGYRTVIPHFEVTSLHNSPPHLYEDMFLGPDQEPYLGDFDDVPLPQIKDFDCASTMNLITEEEQDWWAATYNSRFKRFKHRCPIAWLRWHANGKEGRVDDAGFAELVENKKGPIFNTEEPSLKVFNGCSVLIRAPGDHMFYHHDYSVASQELYRMYHQRWQTSLPPWVEKMYTVDDAPTNDRLIVACHNRLGDVYRSVQKHIKNDNGLGRWVEKMLPPSWPVFHLFLIEAVMGDAAKDCILFHLFADANAKHPYLQYIQAAMNEKSIPFWIHGFDTSSREALDGMAFANLLIVGTSGFGRVATVFNRGVSIAPELEAHRVSNITRVHTVPEPKELLRLDMTPEPALLHALARSNVDWIHQLRDTIKASLLDEATKKGGEAMARRCNLM